MRVQTPRRSAGHLAPLDSVRAVAVTGVVLTHSVPADWAWMNVISPGATGVRVFFVLSGFLITRILIRERDAAASSGHSKAQALRHFYARRGLRILPLFYTVLLVLVILMPNDIRASLPWHLAYVGNYYNALQGEWAGPASHFWSLAVEEQFYLIWPLLVIFLSPAALPRLVWLCVLAGPVSRMLAFLITHNDVAPYVLTTSCLDSLGAGALLAHLHRQDGGMARATKMVGHRIALGAVFLFAAILIVARSAELPLLELAGSELAVSLFAVGVIHAIVARDASVSRLLSWRPLVYLGTISYGIYAWHYPLPWGVKALQRVFGTTLELPAAGWWCFAVSMGVTIAIASVSWYGVERPLNRLKYRFPYLSGSQTLDRGRTHHQLL